MCFSYCLSLPQIGQNQHPQNYLHFGPDAKINGAFKTTQLCDNNRQQEIDKLLRSMQGNQFGWE